MIAIMSLGLMLANAKPIQIDLRESYLAGDPIVVTVTVHNQGAQPLKTPDLSHDTWRTSFHIKGDKLNQVRKTKKKKISKDWKINPYGSRSVKLEAPSSANLKSGIYNLTVKVNADEMKGEATNQIIIESPKPKSIDLLQQNSNLSRVTWIQESNQTGHLYYNSGKENWWITRIEKSAKPRLSVCKECGPELAWQSGNTLRYTDRFGHIKKSPLPWPKAEWLGRAVLSKQLYAVIYAPAPKGNVGDLWLLTIDRKGIPSYQKMRTGGPKPSQVNASLTERKTPLFLVSDARRSELYTADPAFAARNHPVPVKRIRRTLKGERNHDQRLSIHPTHGLSILCSYQQTEEWRYEWRSLNGTALEMGAFHAPSKSVIIDVASQKGKTRWLVQTPTGRFVSTKVDSVPVESTENAILWGSDQLLFFTEKGRSLFR